MEDIFDFLSKFVVLAGTLDYGSRLIKFLWNLFKERKSPRRRVK